MHKFKPYLLVLGASLLLIACNNKPKAPAEAVKNVPAASEQAPVAVAAAAPAAAVDAKTEAAAKADDSVMQDKAGNSYKVVRLGDQLWMAENMKDQTAVTCYANTDKDADFINKYGCLYTWDDAGKVCPADQGWRLPGRDDYSKMLATLGDSPKARSASLCAAEFNNGTNSSGLNVLPAGIWADGYNRFGQVAMFWTATTSDETPSDAYDILVDPGFMGAGVYEAGKTAAYSVRCVRDLK